MTALIDWQWKMLSEPTGHHAAAAYAVRLLNQGSVVSIPRFLGVDAEGLLTIGKTTDLEERRRRFVRGSSKGRGHSSGNTLFFLNFVGVFQKFFREPSYQIAFKPVATDLDARRLESDLTKNYMIRFGEGPPLGSVIPDRYAHLQKG
jgi:hypothetical protein